MEVLSNFQAEVLSGNPLSIATALLAVIVVYYLVKKILNPPKGKAPPTLSGIPILGNAIQFGADPVTLLVNGYKKFGDCFSMTIFGETMTLLASPEGHELFFKAKEDEFSACKSYQFTVPIFGPGVVYDATPEVLVEQRMFAGGALSVRRFKLYVPMIEKECEEYFKNAWGDEGEVELMQAFNEITMLTSTRCLQGREIRETMNVEFAKLYWDLDKCLSAFAFFFPNVPLPSFIDRNRARKRIGEIFQSVIDSRRANPDEVHEDLVQTLMEAKYKDGTPLPDAHIVGLMVGILLAGQHTSNVTGAWLGVHLLSNPDVLQKCLDEQKKIVTGSELSFDQLKDCTYLYQVMRETLRLNPPIIMMMRRVVKDMPYKDYTIRKGSFVVTSPALSHRLDTFYTNPNQFEPERFSPERAEDKKYSFSYLSFGGGKHACIGESFAFVQVRAIWSWLLRHYEMELVTKDVKPNYTTMVVAPTPPVTVRYRRIKN